jgi:hypothetical protein
MVEKILSIDISSNERHPKKVVQNVNAILFCCQLQVVLQIPRKTMSTVKNPTILGGLSTLSASRLKKIRNFEVTEKTVQCCTFLSIFSVIFYTNHPTLLFLNALSKYLSKFVQIVQKCRSMIIRGCFLPYLQFSKCQITWRLKPFRPRLSH